MCSLSNFTVQQSVESDVDDVSCHSEFDVDYVYTYLSSIVLLLQRILLFMRIYLASAVERPGGDYDSQEHMSFIIATLIYSPDDVSERGPFVCIFVVRVSRYDYCNGYPV